MQHELPLGDTFFNLPKATACEQCGEPTYGPVIKQVYVGRCVQVRHFCCDSCHHKFYLNRLRSFGL